MNVSTSHVGGVAVVHVSESRLTYPVLSDFVGAIAALVSGGERQILLDVSSVTYVDSATIGALLDLYRQASAAGGGLKLAGVQKRVETMLSMTGAQSFLEVYADVPSGLASFGG